MVLKKLHFKLVIGFVLILLTINLYAQSGNIFDLTNPDSYVDFYDQNDNFVKPTIRSDVDLTNRESQSNTNQNPYQNKPSQINEDYINTLDATKIDPEVEFKEFMEYMQQNLQTAQSHQAQLIQDTMSKTRETAKKVAEEYCSSISNATEKGRRETPFNVNSSGKKVAPNLENNMPAMNTTMPTVGNDIIGATSAESEVSSVMSDIGNNFQNLQGILNDAAGQMGEAFSSFWKGFSKEKEKTFLKGSRRFRVWQNVSKTNEYLNSLDSSDATKSSKQQLIADSYASCLAEMIPYYENFIYKLALQNLKMNTLFRQGQREIQEIQNKQADLDLTRSIQRHVAGVDPVFDPSELVSEGDKTPEQAKKEMDELAEKAKNYYVAFLDGTVVYGDGTKKIVGKRATLPTDDHNIELLKRAFFSTGIESKDRNGNPLTGFEGILFSSSNDPLLSLLFALTLADIVNIYDLEKNAEEDQKGLNKSGIPGFIINHICALNPIISNDLQNALSKFSQISKATSTNTYKTIGSNAVAILNMIMDDITNSFVNEYANVSPTVQKIASTDGFEIDSFTLDTLIENVIKPGYDKTGAYSDIIALVNSYRHIDTENTATLPSETEQYAIAYLNSLGTQSGYFNGDMNAFRSYLNRDYGSRLVDAVNRYLSQLKQYEMDMLNEPVFESVNTSIIHANQINAIENIQLQIDKEYSGYENLTKLRCLF
jgi:hypothetical protein